MAEENSIIRTLADAIRQLQADVDAAGLGRPPAAGGPRLAELELRVARLEQLIHQAAQVIARQGYREAALLALLAESEARR